MAMYGVIRTGEYLEHFKKQKTNPDGSRDWTDEGLAWRREQYRLQKAQKRNESKEYFNDLKKAIKDEMNSGEGKNKGKAKKETLTAIYDVEKGVDQIGNTVDEIVRGKSYDKNRAALQARASKMSDEQLRAITNRINLERNYADAVMSKDAKRGKVTFGRIMSIVGGATALAAGGLVIADHAYNIYERVHG